MANTLVQEFIRELEEEAPATRKCLERIPENLFSWKPHEKSMVMSGLVNILSEIPKWVTVTAEKSEIDFATWERFKPTTTAEVVAHFDEEMKKVKEVLLKFSDEDLNAPFHLKMDGKVLATSSKMQSISSSIRHSAHHRGQLTVYMRMNNIAVPSIYGPSADENKF